MKVIVYAISKNESSFVARWMESMAEADDIIVLDTGSTDDTVDQLRRLGAQVYEARIVPWRFDVARNLALEYVPEDADICVSTDLDEIFHPGWRQALEAAWKPGTTRARYDYIWNHRPDGSPDVRFMADKIHARHGYCWRSPVHETLFTEEPEVMVNTTACLEHFADHAKSRAQYLPLLELAVAEDPDNDRHCHYLGREYFFHRQYDKAIICLQRHLTLPKAVWPDERCASMRYLAACYRALKNDAEAERWLMRAVAEAPHLREPWMELAELYRDQKRWYSVVHACLSAKRLTHQPDTYITNCAAWQGLPDDHLAVAYYELGQYEKSLEAAEAALQWSPENERLLANRDLIAQRLQQH